MSNVLTPEPGCFYYSTNANKLVYCVADWGDQWRFHTVNKDDDFGISKTHLEEGFHFFKKVAFLSND